MALTARTKSYLKAAIADGTSKELIYKEIVAMIEVPTAVVSKKAATILGEALSNDKAAKEMLNILAKKAASAAAAAANVAAQAALALNPSDVPTQNAATAAAAAAAAALAAIPAPSKRLKADITVNLTSDNKSAAEVIKALS